MIHLAFSIPALSAGALRGGRLRDRAQFFSVDHAVECYLNVLLGD